MGLRVALHDSRALPLPDDDGVNAAVGELTSIAVRVRQVLRQKAPYKSNCTNEFPAAYKLFARHEWQKYYNVRMCNVACRSASIFNKLNCFDTLQVRNAYVDNGGTDKTIKMCSATYKKMDDLYYILGVGDTNRSLECECPAACNETIFEPSVSSLKWPSPAFQRMLMINPTSDYDINLPEYVRQAHMTAESTEKAHKRVANNLLKIHVFLESNTVEIIEESPAYPFSQLMSDFGGTLGLYIGLNIVTIFEIIHLLSLLCHVAAYGNRRNQVQHMPNNQFDDGMNRPRTDSTALVAYRDHDPYKLDHMMPPHTSTF